MVIVCQARNYSQQHKKTLNVIRYDPFFIIYNHRRSMRARVLKKLKQEKKKIEKKMLKAQLQAQKEQNLKNWNHSMLQQDNIWQNAYDLIKKQSKQQDSTITRTTNYHQKIEKIRNEILYTLSISQKRSVFTNNFTTFNYIQNSDQAQIIFQNS